MERFAYLFLPHTDDAAIKRIGRTLLTASGSRENIEIINPQAVTDWDSRRVDREAIKGADIALGDISFADSNVWVSMGMMLDRGCPVIASRLAGSDTDLPFTRADYPYYHEVAYRDRGDLLINLTRAFRWLDHLPDLKGADTTQLPRFIHNDGLAISLREQSVHVRGSHVRLTPTEYRLLVVLATNLGEPVSKKDLLAKVWGDTYSHEGYQNEHILPVTAHRVRVALGDTTSPYHYIVTSPGFGYVMPNLNEHPTETIRNTFTYRN